MRRNFTLIEVLIALGLGAVLFTFLLQTYLFIAQSAQQAAVENNALFPKRHLLHRLNPLFCRLSSRASSFFVLTDDRHGLFLPGSRSLLFTYDNGVCVDASFTGLVTSWFFVDRQGRLTLITWPEVNQWVEGQPSAFRYEVFMEGVTDMDIRCFNVRPTVGWTGALAKENGLPAIVEITLKRAESEEKEIFPFLVPQGAGFREEKRG